MLVLVIYPRQGPHRKRPFHYCVFSRCSGVSTELFLATAIVLSPVYTAITWQWVYMSQYITGERMIIAVAHLLRLRSDTPCSFSSLFSLPTGLQPAAAITIYTYRRFRALRHTTTSIVGLQRTEVGFGVKSFAWLSIQKPHSLLSHITADSSTGNWLREISIVAYGPELIS
jgi:hypothetical protein